MKGRIVNAWKLLRQFVPAALTACGVAAAGGQTVTYLAPAKHVATLGERVTVRTEIGDGKVVQRAAWPTETIHWLFVRAPGMQENRENVGPADPKDDFIDVTLTKPGVTMVGRDTKPTVTNVTGEKFKAFLTRTAPEETQKDVLAGIADEDKARVRRIESTKTLVRVLDADGKPPSHSAVAQSKTGQAVEIRALADPTLVAIGSDLPVRAYVDGDTRTGVKMLATCVATGKTQEALTDSSGSCHFRISDPGVWRIEFHDARPLENDADADWVVYSATLTFEVTKAGAGK
jgi:hypothetical protein